MQCSSSKRVGGVSCRAGWAAAVPTSCELDLVSRAWLHPAGPSASSPCFATTTHPYYYPLRPIQSTSDAHTQYMYHRWCMIMNINWELLKPLFQVSVGHFNNNGDRFESFISPFPRCSNECQLKYQEIEIAIFLFTFWYFVSQGRINLFRRFLLKIKRFFSRSLQSLLHICCRAFVKNPVKFGKKSWPVEFNITI